MNSQVDSTNNTVTVQIAHTDCMGTMARLIDVREKDEYARGHAAGAELFPLSAWPGNFLETSPQLDEPLYLICRSGGRSSVALAMLKAKGFTKLYNVDGGTLAWQTAKLPMD